MLNPAGLFAKDWFSVIPGRNDIYVVALEKEMPD